MHSISSLKFRGTSDALIIIQPTMWEWAGSSSFLVIALTGNLLTWFTKRLLKGDFEDYVAYQVMKAGYDSYRVWRFLSPILVTISLFFLVIVSDSYTVFYKDKIKVNYYFSLGSEEYTYNDIVKISIKKGPKEKKDFIILFSDGKDWCSSHNDFDDYEKNYAIIKLIGTKRNLKTFME